MENTYIWDTSIVDTYPSKTDSNNLKATDVIFNVHWVVTGINGEHQTLVEGTQPLDIGDLSNFKDFDSVRRSDVESWVKSAMGPERIAEIEAMLDSQLLELMSPHMVTRVVAR